jgi:ABC-type transport system involved in multi-copper enzyme maturation permease subunit
MPEWNLVRVMVLKEIRMTLRERSQMLRMTMSLVILTLVVGNSMYQVTRLSHRTRPGLPRPGIAQKVEGPLMNWALIAGATGGGFFFSSGYLIAAILACFVGEKENRTLEILLASPLSDLKIFLLKTASVMIPSALLGCASAVVGVAAVAAMLAPAGQTILQSLAYGLVLGLPALFLLQMCGIGLGAAISVSAETMKGAGQTLGVVMAALIFLPAYGMPILLRSNPAISQAVAEATRNFLSLSFPLQYGALLAALAVAAAVFMSIGRMLFQRDRMLA